MSRIIRKSFSLQKKIIGWLVYEDSEILSVPFSYEVALQLRVLLLFLLTTWCQSNPSSWTFVRIPLLNTFQRTVLVKLSTSVGRSYEDSFFRLNRDCTLVFTVNLLYLNKVRGRKTVAYGTEKNEPKIYSRFLLL